MHRKDIRNIASITAISISSETKTFFQLVKNTRPCSCMLFLHTVKISSHLLMCVALFGFHLPERRQMGSGAWIIEWQNQNKNTTITTMPFSLSSLSITADSIKAARTFGTKSQACQDRESFKLALGWHIISYMRLFLEMFFFFSPRSIFVTDSPANMSQRHKAFQFTRTSVQILKTSPFYQSDIFYWTGTNGISLDNLLTFKGW